MVVTFISGGEIRFDKPFHTRAGKALRSLTSRWRLDRQSTASTFLNFIITIGSTFLRFVFSFSALSDVFMHDCELCMFYCHFGLLLTKSFGLRNWVLQFIFATSVSQTVGQRPVSRLTWLRPSFALWFSLVNYCNVWYPLLLLFPWARYPKWPTDYHFHFRLSFCTSFGVTCYSNYPRLTYNIF